MSKLNQELLKKKLEARAASDMECGRAGALAMSVMQDGEMIYEQCFTDEKQGFTVTPQSLFRLASMTKPITAVAVLILAEREQLRLEQPVSDFIPEYRQMNIGSMDQSGLVIIGAAKQEITIRHLLTHTSGLGSGPVGDYVSRKMPPQDRKNLAQMVAYYAENPLDFEPMTSAAYSPTHAFDVAARIVELVSGKTYDKFLEEEIFLPLGMKDTTFSPTKEQWKRMVPMHTYKDGEEGVDKMPEDSIFEGVPTACFLGGAGLASTLQDYKNFAAMLLNEGSFQGYQLLSQRTVREMATSTLAKEIVKNSEAWGLGVRVVTENTYPSLPCGTFGWSGAYGTHFWVDPVNRITAIYMRNSRYEGGSGSRMSHQFEQDVHDCLII